MKIRVLVVIGCLISFTCASFAQDVIVTKDARKISAKVTEVNVNDIKYKNFDNMDGPTYTLLKSDIASILYQNGQVETFETQSTQTQATLPTPVQSQSQVTIQPNQLTGGNILSRMQKDDPILYQQYIKGRRQARMGTFLMIIGGGMTGLGIGGIVSGDEAVEIGAVFAVAGGLCLSAGIPIRIIGGTKKNNALNTYRRKYTSTQSTPYFQINLHGNGMGLAYVF